MDSKISDLDQIDQSTAYTLPDDENEAIEYTKRKFNKKTGAPTQVYKKFVKAQIEATYGYFHNDIPDLVYDLSTKTFKKRTSIIDNRKHGVLKSKFIRQGYQFTEYGHIVKVAKGDDENEYKPELEIKIITEAVDFTEHRKNRKYQSIAKDVIDTNLYDRIKNVRYNITLETQKVLDAYYAEVLTVEAYARLQEMMVGVNIDGGYKVIMKLYYQSGHEKIPEGDEVKIDEKGIKYGTATLDMKNDEVSMESISKFLQKKIEAFQYGIVVTAFEFIIVSLPTAGGCNKHKTQIGSKNFNNLKVRYTSCKSINNNCLLACYLQFMGLSGKGVKPDSLREKLNIPLGIALDKNHNRTLAEHFEVDYTLINEMGAVIDTQFTGNDKHITLLIGLNGDEPHYYLVQDTFTREKCDKCGHKYWSDKDHKCNMTNKTYYSKVVKKEKLKFVPVKNIKEKQKVNSESICFFDIETSPTLGAISGQLRPYAVKDNHNLFWGKECMTEFVYHLTKSEYKYCCAYNGSGFDFYILVNELIKQGHKVDKMILSSGKLMSFMINDTVKCFDLYLFIMSSLSSACKAFKCDVMKGDFDHTKIKTWDDVDVYRVEWEPYLNKDVECLIELYDKFNTMIYSLLEVNICTKYVTLSNLAYEVWSSMLTDDIEIPNEYEKYAYIRSSVYGGRCYPQKKYWKSEHYDDVVSGKMTYEELKSSGDYVYCADDTSLYPASMVGVENIMKFEFPGGESRWSEEGSKEWNDGKCGFYSVKIECPKNKRLPVIPSPKIENGHRVGVRWDLNDKEGVYASVDILNALENDYKVKFLGKCLVYDAVCTPFTKYVNMWYELKKEATIEGNKVKRSISKLMLNALYGKMLMRPIFETTEVINSYSELVKFISINKVTDYQRLSPTKWIFSGELYNTEEKEKNITKPSQMGSFILANSRRIMLKYFRALDITLERIPFLYTDTDCMHIMGKDYDKLYKLGYIPDEEKLGYLSNDLDNGGLIINEINLAPKTYMNEYITEDGGLYTNDLSKMKAKGIPKINGLTKEKVLISKLYKDEGGDVKYSSLKKLNKSISKSDKEKGYNHFDIKQMDIKKEFNKKAFDGMYYNSLNHEFYPNGYDKISPIL